MISCGQVRDAEVNSVESLVMPIALEDDAVTTASSITGTAAAALPWPYGASASAHNVTPIGTAACRRGSPVQAADVAQARLFAALLQSEIIELEDVAESAERRWLQRRVRGSGDDRLPAELVRLGERVAEARRLLAALGERFPHD